MKGKCHRVSKVGVASLAVFAALSAFCGHWAMAQAAWLSASGTSGLLMTPTADLVSDRSLVLGASFVDKKWAVAKRGENNNVSYFVTLGYLPRIEVSMRLTVFPGSSFAAAGPGRIIKDRILSVKALLVRERMIWPAVAVGSEDLVGTKRFHTLFAVLGKDLNVNRIELFRIHAGAGTDWIDAKNHPLDGVFGGITKRLWKGGEVLIEYDSDKVNAGFGFEPVSSVRLLLSALNLESFAGALYVQFALK